MKKTLLTATALTALSFSAFAADLPKRTVAPVGPAPIFSWTGFYVGGTVGSITNTTKTNDDFGLSMTNSGAGAAFGLTAGYNYQIGSTVVGVEADYSFTQAQNNFGDYYAGGDSTLKGLGTVRARVGYTFDRTLLYVTGGLAFARVNSGAYYYYNDADCRAGFGNKFQTGWTVGAGVEHALTDRLSIKAEALYASFGKKSATSECGCRFGFKTSNTVARVGVNYKF